MEDVIQKMPAEQSHTFSTWHAGGQHGQVQFRHESDELPHESGVAGGQCDVEAGHAI